MKTLKDWLDEGRGRCTALAQHLNVSVGRVSQMADDGVPPKFMLAVRTFTKEEVSLEAMVAARTPPPKGSESDTEPGAERANARTTMRPKRQRENHRPIDKPSS